MGRRVALGIVFGGVILLVLDAIAVRVGVAEGIVPTSEGASFWITSRAAGVTAFVALTLDVVFGLFVSTGAADQRLPRAKSVEIHRWLSGVALSLTAMHALALLGDRHVRFDAIDLLVPFASVYRPFAVGLGVVATYAAFTVHRSFAWRRRLGARTWRKLHYLSFFVYAAAVAHGLLAGSDSGTMAMRALYVASAGVVASLVVLRILGARVSRARAASRTPSARAS